MEQHPVPRNITGFQFRLIGDMTVRQFAYLLTGFVLGYLFIRLLPSIFAWPLGIFFALAGIAFAFIPIQERPLDRWLAAFIKSITSPTQYLWHKDNPPPAILLTRVTKKLAKMKPQQTNHYHDSRKKLKAYLSKLPQKPESTVETAEAKRLAATLSLFVKSSATSQKPPPQQEQPKIVSFTPKPEVKKEPPATLPPLPDQAKEVKREEVKKEPTMETLTDQTRQLSYQIAMLGKKLSQENIDSQRLADLETQLRELLAEKDGLKKELDKLRRKSLPKEEQQVVRPSTFKEEEPPEKVMIITPKVAKQSGFPSIPKAPNIISGIVKDSTGKLLANILVTVRDKDGVPVRALKTNKLGQFASSTSLPKGVYTLEFEDPQSQYHFAIIEITLTDDLVTPLEILAKSEKEAHREKLMKEIFDTLPN